MPAALDIREEGRVLVFTLTDPWELSDLISLGMRSRMHMDRASDKIYRVYDVRGTKHIPAGMSQAQSLISFRHNRSGELVTIGVSTIAGHFAGDKHFDSDDEAWTYLRDLLAPPVEQPKQKRKR
jgi:hypothetical protein